MPLANGAAQNEHLAGREAPREAAIFAASLGGSSIHGTHDGRECKENSVLMLAFFESRRCVSPFVPFQKSSGRVSAEGEKATKVMLIEQQYAMMDSIGVEGRILRWGDAWEISEADTTRWA